MKLLRELQQYPDDQAYLCNCADVAGRFGLPCPFRCGEPLWKGGGLLTVMFFTPGGQLETAWVDIKNLSALAGETFPCMPAWERL